MLTTKYIGENTNVLLFDGRIKKVQDLLTGDKLMSLQKDHVNIVVAVNHRQDENVYRIVQNYGVAFTIHEKQTLNILARNKLYKVKTSSLHYNSDKAMSLLHSSVPFGHAIELLDIYFIGLFIGNEEHSFHLDKIKIKNDTAYFGQLKEIVKKNEGEIIIENDFIIITDKKYKLINQLLKLNLHFQKIIPNVFKGIDLYNKFFLLAGIMDSTETRYNKENASFELYNISPNLHNNLIYLIRSMGYYCYSRYNNNLYTIHIHGKYLYHIPMIKKHEINFQGDVINNFTAVKIKNINYYEVEITNDYILLEDFTLI